MNYPTLYYPTYHSTPKTASEAKELFYSGRQWYAQELTTDANVWLNVSVSIRTFEYGVHKCGMVNLCFASGGEILVPVIIPERERMPVTFSDVCEDCRMSQCFCSAEYSDSKWPLYRQFGGYGK
jgi:hypothetical protein